MKHLTYNKQVNRRKLTGELQAAGIAVISVGTNLDASDQFISTYVDVVDNANETTIQNIVDAHNTTGIVEGTIAEAKQWFIDNPNATQIFTLSIADLWTEIVNLVDAIIPLATAGNRTKLKLFLMGLAVSVRVLVKREFKL